MEWNADSMSSAIRLEDDNIISQIETENSTTFINDEISSGHHEYEFKVIQYKRICESWTYADIIIGILTKSSVAETENVTGGGFNRFNGYSYVASHSETRDYFPDQNAKIKRIPHKIEIQNGTLIKMIVDLNKKKLDYYLDDQCVARISSIRQQTYMPAIYLFAEDIKIQLLP